MARFRNLDTNGDWQYGSGQNDYVKDAEAVKLDVKTRLQEWLGDCFFNQDAGIDYINRLGNKDQETLLEQDIRTIILQTEGVASLNEFSFSTIDRSFSASYNITTIYSDTFDDFIEQVG